MPRTVRSCRAPEPLGVVGQYRFLPQALDEIAAASEKLAGLELTRSMVLASTGYPADVRADELAASRDVSEDVDDALRSRIADLRSATIFLAEVRTRVDHEVRSPAKHTRRHRADTEAVAAG